MSQKQNYSAEERKAQIVSTAACLFARRGFAGTTSAALAKACGVSEALIYKLFASKKGLYEAIIAHKLTSFPPLVVEPDSPETLEEVLARLAERIFAQVSLDPDFVRLLHYCELQESAVARLFQEARGPDALSALGGYLRSQGERGLLRSDLDPYLVAANFFCLTWQSAVSLKVFERDAVYPPTPDAEASATIVSIFARGLRP